MATERAKRIRWRPPVSNGDAPGFNRVMEALESLDAATLCDAISDAGELLRTRQADDTESGEIGRRFVALAGDHRSDVQHAVALAIEHLHHPTFAAVAGRLQECGSAVAKGIATGWIKERTGTPDGGFRDDHHEELLQRLLGTRERGPDTDDVRSIAEQYAGALLDEVDHHLVSVLQPTSTGLGNLARLLEEPRPDLAACREAVARARHRVRILIAIVDSTFAYARDIEPSFRPVSLLASVNAAVALFRERNRIREKDLELRVEVAPDLSLVMDGELIAQTLRHLLQNAFESLEGTARKAISVVARREERHVEIDVVDNGKGMTDAMKRSGFHLYTTSKRGGRGMGLPNVLRIVERIHRGRITLKSELGKGTTMTMRLPRDQRGAGETT